MLKQKKVLVTGAAGFTGRHLVRLLSKDASLSLFLAGFALRKETTQYPCDFLDPVSVQKLVADIRPDVVYHLIGSYTNDYDTDYASNVLSTRNILDALRTSDTKTRVLLVGSCAEYGLPLDSQRGVSEEHSLRPVSMYGLMKLYQHDLMETYVRLYGMDIVAVRPFNLRGKGMLPALFIGKMEQEIQRYKRGEIREIVTGDLSVERDYIDIDEAIKYYSVVLEKGKCGETYNVGSGQAKPLRSILKDMLSAEGLSMDIVREGRHDVRGKLVVPKIFADITKLRKLSNF
ncbi:MAG: NAD-dependent epimerase/dehydratase family protein [bacterium]|nr:NAD-dependent epimerase/dehydratase family protein [bacterium]